MFPLCPLDSQPTVRQNSVFGARHSNGGLRAVLSRLGPGLSPGKEPQARPFPKPPHANLSYTIYMR